MTSKRHNSWLDSGDGSGEIFSYTGAPPTYGVYSARVRHDDIVQCGAGCGYGYHTHLEGNGYRHSYTNYDPCNLSKGDGWGDGRAFNYSDFTPSSPKWFFTWLRAR